MNPIYTKVDDYIQCFPAETQEVLQAIRSIILEIVPEVKEEIAYAMPAYKLNNKPFVYFAAFTKHIGFYAIPSAHAAFSEQLSPYKHGKGSVQFPLNKPIPYELIREIVEFKKQKINS